MLQDSDEDDLNDLNQLNAVLEADKQIINEETVSDSCSTTTNAALHSKVSEELSLIDTALTLNKLTDEKLRKLENLLIERLQDCKKKKLADLRDVRPTNYRQACFRYHYCAKPYFKDKYNFAAPSNEDTILMLQSNMFDFSQIVAVTGWTLRDKSQFLAELHKMSQTIRKNELHEKISVLRRARKTKDKKEIDKEIAKLSKELYDVKKKPLSELALDIDEDYDWDVLANKLNRRHTAQEYQALWKLFFHPSINKKTWTKAEHLSLQSISSAHKFQDWDTIAKELNTGRTGYQCFVYFRTNMVNSFNGRKWTEEEEEYLRRLIDYYREDTYIPWGRVAAAMENRTKIQIYNKYTRLVGNRKGRFLPEEDAVILNYANKFGTNFRKMLTYLPGRSMVQIRNRYRVLSKRCTSTVWTEEEDKMLIQLMANQDGNVNFSSVSTHFPGKDRENLRSRYITLLKWMRKHPNVDIKHAPRRGARRLTHGEASADLNKALEDLKNRMENEVKTKKSKRMTRESSERDIEKAIIASLVNELLVERDMKLTEQYEKDLDIIDVDERPPSLNVTNLNKILTLLNASINKTSFQHSSYATTYPELLSNTQVNLTQVKSYSRKNISPNNLDCTTEIWGNNALGPVKHVLPPHYATITGCRSLIAYACTKTSQTEIDVNINHVMKRNTFLRDQFNLLIDRFNTLFLWPMLLSNESPYIPNLTVPGTSKETQKRTYMKNQTPSDIPAYHVPYKIRSKNRDNEINKINEIDLKDKFLKDDVTIKEQFTECGLMEIDDE
ncbi:snRNA-activating protein complex subunit 4 [Bombyx mori]|uniref:snRNA-activating protein complex subunit 4 n=1 Tax=Bombyx mori TaxID=7091 RepID=A0A8R2RA82_BOMMO|nr:snRNA-activating protein complex subunit 4 [Bombyx mori]